MRLHGLPVNRLWLLGVAAVLLLAAHLGALRYVFIYGKLSAGIAGGLLVLIVINHLGLLGWLLGLIRRRPGP